MTLKEAIAEAEKGGVAIGHFNISEITTLRAVTEAAHDLKVPVIIGTSEGEAGFIGFRQAAALVKSLREDLDHPIFLNADHLRSLENIKRAVEAGYDAVIFDGTNLSLEENIRKTREAVDYVKSASVSRRTEVLVEGEIGYVGVGSLVREEAPEGVELVSAEEASRFVQETRVDLLAPAVGNVHGIIKSGEPKLEIERIREIKKAVRIPLVLHGASGNSDEDIRSAVQAGISIIHINTEIRVAWRKGLEAFLKIDFEEIAPYKILSAPENKIYEVVCQKLRLFTGQ